MTRNDLLELMGRGIWYDASTLAAVSGGDVATVRRWCTELVNEGVLEIGAGKNDGEFRLAMAGPRIKYACKPTVAERPYVAPFVPLKGYEAGLRRAEEMAVMSR